MIGRAAGGDDDVAGVGRLDRLAHRRDLRAGLIEQAGRDFGLLADLIYEGHVVTSKPCPRE